MKQYIENLPLSKKIQGIVIIATTLALILSCSAFIGVGWYSLRNSVKLDALGLADAIGNNCTAALLFRDRTSAHEIISALGSDSRIMEAALYQQDGTIFTSYHPKDRPAFKTFPAYQSQTVYFQNDSLIVFRDIIMDHERIGGICIRISLDSLYSLLIRVAIISILITGGVLLLTYFLASRLQNIVSKPVLDLARTVKSISKQKNYRIRALKTAQDEVGDLIDGFNEMLEQIQKRDSDLDQHGKNLGSINDQLSIAINKAEQASKAKSDFLAKMSHEFRTPLNAIIGYSELLKEEMEGSKEQYYLPDLDRIHHAARHLLTLINDVLDISKIESGKMELYLETFDVRQLTREVLSTTQAMVEKNGNELIVSYGTGLTRMTSDPVKLRQTLLNLIGNSGKFTKNGRVELHVSQVVNNGSDWLRFQVKDTGIGISPENQKILFQAFTQADSSTARKYGGTGLGLAITQRFVEIMEGRITVESVLGQGSTFELQIPLEHSAVQKAAQSSEHPFPESLGNSGRYPVSDSTIPADQSPEVL
jgi:signal transduction histidine kinase